MNMIDTSDVIDPSGLSWFEYLVEMEKRSYHVEAEWLGVEKPELRNGDIDLLESLYHVDIDYPHISNRPSSTGVYISPKLQRLKALDASVSLDRKEAEDGKVYYKSEYDDFFKTLKDACQEMFRLLTPLTIQSWDHESKRFLFYLEPELQDRGHIDHQRVHAYQFSDDDPLGSIDVYDSSNHVTMDWYAYEDDELRVSLLGVENFTLNTKNQEAQDILQKIAYRLFVILNYEEDNV